MIRLWLTGLLVGAGFHGARLAPLGIHGGPRWDRIGKASEARGPIVINVKGQELKMPYVLASRTTDYYHATASQGQNIELAASRLNGVVVSPGQVFSYYNVVGPYTAANGFGWGRMFVGDRIVPSVGGGVCQGSSTLYSALLRTGLPIVERHRHGLTVPYLPPGEDATVASTYLNFRFRNNRTTPVLISAHARDRHITVALWGMAPGPEIVVKHKILARYPFPVINQTNRRLNPGETKVVAPGQDGVKAESWLEIKTQKGIAIKNLGVDTYRPSPRIVERGPIGS